MSTSVQGVLTDAANTTTTQLQGEAWQLLLSRVGDTLMLYLLMHTSLFLPLSHGCFLQASGACIAQVLSPRQPLAAAGAASCSMTKMMMLGCRGGRAASSSRQHPWQGPSPLLQPRKARARMSAAAPSERRPALLPLRTSRLHRLAPPGKAMSCPGPQKVFSPPHNTPGDALLLQRKANRAQVSSASQCLLQGAPAKLPGTTRHGISARGLLCVPSQNSARSLAGPTQGRASAAVAESVLSVQPARPAGSAGAQQGCVKLQPCSSQVVHSVLLCPTSDNAVRPHVRSNLCLTLVGPVGAPMFPQQHAQCVSPLKPFLG